MTPSSSSLRPGRVHRVAGLLLGVVLGAISCGGPAGDERARSERSATEFVGRERCARCHEREDGLWAGSDHDLAMQPAREGTVLGDFDDATFEYDSTVFRFSRRDGGFFVRTDGRDGEPRDYEVAYTFGVTPLQQYLIPFEGGRYQALGVCWDTRPEEQGGQRWFHLYPGEGVRPGDPLHWTGPNQTWNFQCAECHSTGLRKNYDVDEDSYATEWAEIDVSCEACHGPGSRHVVWAEAGEDDRRRRELPGKGLDVDLKATPRSAWRMDPGATIARLDPPSPSRTEIESCARCHSLRSPITDPYEYGRPLADTHRPSLLVEPDYYPDGQIRGEVYVYGSFLQSRMYRAGVTCSDCHDPHSLDVLAPGNALCARCHSPATYDTPEHHFHRPASAGARCVECHMPATNYMVVDARRDHGMRVPRPDLSIELGTPNACNRCHTDRTAAWAARAVTEWYGPAAARAPHFGRALHAAETGRPGAGGALVELAGDREQPAIVRATAISLLARYPEAVNAGTVVSAQEDASPLVRRAGVALGELFEPASRFALLAPALEDPVRSVRIEAGQVLAPVPARMLRREEGALRDSAIAERIAAEGVNADRPEAHLNLGELHAARREFAGAEAEYRRASRLDPAFVPAYVNLADLYRVLGRDPDGEQVLRRALRGVPDSALLHHSLGLVLTRLGRVDEAVAELRTAARLDPSDARLCYVYAVALHSAGKAGEAIATLESAISRFPGDRDMLIALATMNEERGDLPEAIRHAAVLVERWPRDERFQELLQRLQDGPAE